MNNPKRFNQYHVEIADGQINSKIVNGENIVGFIPPDTKNGLSKIYVVKRAGEIYYVGVTVRPIRERLRVGFSAKGEHGYYGYKWKEQDEVELLVWCFPEYTKDYLEAVEAELVYLIREKTGKWPKYQMEIHFHQASGKALQDARLVLDEIVG